MQNDKNNYIEIKFTLNGKTYGQAGSIEDIEELIHNMRRTIDEREKLLQ